MPDDLGELIPEHGNGAVCERLSNKGKISFRAYPNKASTIPAYLDYQNHTHAAEHSASIAYESDIAQYMNVPKDSRGPRGIALQPTRMMSYQKAAMRILYEFIEEASPARGFINFTDQAINQELARSASLDQKYCTIDLKDASDLVSWNLIKAVVSDEWLDILTSTRCTSIDVNGENHQLKKFASMGSALCFPIEAICFWAICRTVSNEVYVYGDDIIAPNQDYEAIVQALEDYGLIVNTDKSLHNGFFRESCGGDYYYGNSIAPLRLKSIAPQNVIAFANNMLKAGFSEAADNIVSTLENKGGQIYCRGSINDEVKPFVFNNGRLISNLVFFKRRWRKDIQIYEHRIPSMTTSKTKDVPQSQYDLYYDWLRQASFRGPQRENDWFGIQAAQSVETRAGYKWVEINSPY